MDLFATIQYYLNSEQGNKMGRQVKKKDLKLRNTPQELLHIAPVSIMIILHRVQLIILLNMVHFENGFNLNYQVPYQKEN